MKKFMIVAGLALAAVSAANADVKFDVAGGVFGNGTNAPQTKTFETTPLVGTLTGVVVSFTYSAPASGSWASDFIVALNGISWGGFNTTFGNIDQGNLVGLPDSGTAGNYVGTGTGGPGPFPTFNGNTTTILYGNGWLNSGGATFTNISITLKGVDKVPAPGAMALLGLAGFAARRRRA